MKSFCGLCANFIKTWGCGVTRKAPRVWPRRVMVDAIRVYQRFVSPVLPPSCRFYPSCSRYTLLAVQKHGVLKGGLMGAWRILRCNPFSKGGVDPVR